VELGDIIMGREIFLNGSSLDLEINAVVYAAEQLDTDVSIPVAGGNMPSFEKILKTYVNISEAVKNCRSMSLAAAENIRNAAEAVKRTDRNLFR